jgi:hypothetical protein
MNSRCIYLDRDFWSDTPKDKDVLSGIYRILKSNDIYTNINKEELLSDRILSQLCQDGGFRFYYDANLPEELTIKDHESLQVLCVYAIIKQEIVLKNMVFWHLIANL